MHISRVSIQNFRNFENVTVETNQNLLLVGANATGKSNFIYALQLVLDSSLSRRDRMLTADDFWRGNDLSPWQGRIIRISVELSDFQDDPNLLSFLADYGSDSGQANVARLTYVFRPRGNVIPEHSRETDYEFRIYGGNDENNEVTQLFRHLNLRVIDALRNAEAELVARRLPLKSLLELYGINADALHEVITHLQAANDRLQDVSSIQGLETDIKARLKTIKEHIHELDPVLRLVSNSPDDVVRALRILLEKDRLLPISTTSLGLANLLFLALSLLEIEKRESITRPVGEDVYEFIILAIEEPEAHLHPHVQRLLFRDFLKRSPLILSTHSPHIASVASIDSILMFRKPSAFEGTTINSTARLRKQLKTSEIADLVRYLDITRAEILFARAVLFVEGDAEEFVIPALAHLIDYELERYGITVCNVRGTHFRAYVKLVGPKGLNIPFAILTDGDKYANLKKIAVPQARNSGIITDNEESSFEELSPIELREELERRGIAYYDGLKRCIDLLDTIKIDDAAKAKIEEDYNNLRWADVRQKLENVGIFINEWTFEPSFIEAGFGEEILEVLEECDTGPRVILKLGNQLVNGSLDDEEIVYWGKQISDAGKGRVGQRLSTKLYEMHLPGGRNIPMYIKASIEYLVQRLESVN